MTHRVVALLLGLCGTAVLALSMYGTVFSSLPARAQGTPPQPMHVQQNTAGTNTAPNYQDVSATNAFPIFPVPSSAAAIGITPVVSASAENNHVLKATAGNLYSVYATNLTSTAGFLVVLNSATAPGDGAITPLECVPLPGNATANVNYGSGPPGVYSTGITVVVSSANTCFTKTTGVITAFIHGLVQ